MKDLRAKLVLLLAATAAVVGFGCKGNSDPGGPSAWTSIASSDDAPYSGRAFWTGAEMLIWDDDGGALYSPTTDTWRLMSLEGAPLGRYSHVSVWTGNQFLIWGGTVDSVAPLDSGFAYNLVTDEWQPMGATGDVPEHRELAAAVWTGEEMIVWGGMDDSGDVRQYYGNGAAYNPVTGSWRAISDVGAPTARVLHFAFWTGTRMIICGGWNSDGAAASQGALYDPVADEWSPMSTSGAPAEFTGTVLLAGSRLIAWGGDTFEYIPGEGAVTSLLNTGAVYDISTDSWSPTSVTGAPSARSRHQAVWTGSGMIVWGGSDELDGADVVGETETGGIYDPVTDTWQSTPTEGAPSPRFGHAMVWTGDSMIVWGGWQFVTSSMTVALGDGGIYRPE